MDENQPIESLNGDSIMSDEKGIKGTTGPGVWEVPTSLGLLVAVSDITWFADFWKSSIRDGTVPLTDVDFEQALLRERVDYFAMNTAETNIMQRIQNNFMGPLS
jgi:hypothetical protein